jgi:hypothetical protein
VYVVICVLREREREGEGAREREGARESREREREREREGERKSAQAYVVSRSPQTDTLVPGFALHENTCLQIERQSCTRAATALQNRTCS